MRRFPNPFKTSRRLPHHEGNISSKPMVEDASPRKRGSSSPSQFHQRAPEAAYTLSPGEISSELQHIQKHVHLTSARIRHLQQLVEHENVTLAQVIEMKQQLRRTHRDLEQFYEKVRRDKKGREVADAVGDAGRGVWRAYRRIVGLEEMLRDEENGGDGGEEILVSGALPVQEEPREVIREATSDALENLRALPRFIAHGVQPQTSSEEFSSSPRLTGQGDSNEPASEQTNPEQWPQPRHEVIERLQKEESNASLHLNDSDRVRRGSCNGFTIAELIMSGVEDHRFVLPYLHHIKHHELRALREWLIERHHIRKSGTMSRMEKLLQCIQLLQTGNRYESIATIFSRSPRQTRESCHEVMAGLLDLYDATVDESSAQEVYAPLWGLWKRFELNELRAEKYYGFRWHELAKVLIALNLYIGRWRGSTSPFEGRSFEWGRYLGAKSSGEFLDEMDRVEELQESSESPGGNGTSSSSSYIPIAIQAIPRPIDHDEAVQAERTVAVAD